MQSDQQLISQLGDAVEGAKKSLEETKQRHKARITALRAEQRREIQKSDECSNQTMLLDCYIGDNTTST